MRTARMVAMLMVPLLLASCLLAPGAFTSTLDLKRNGDFAFSYVGEIVFQSPGDTLGDAPPPPWSDSDAHCPSAEAMMDNAADAMENMADAVSNGVDAATAANNSTNMTSEDSRPCTAPEIAEQRKTYEADRVAKIAKNRKEAAQFGAMFGYTPGDDAANQKLAATIMRYDGWKSVVYKGDGVYQVEYRAAGRLTQDFVFPMMPQADIIFPFVALRRQADGSVRFSAPSLIGGGLRGLAAQMKAMGASGGDDRMPQSNRTRGTFTLTTDGEVLTNNTENGPARTAAGRQLVWEIGPTTEKPPEALIGLR